MKTDIEPQTEEVIPTEKAAKVRKQSTPKGKKSSAKKGAKTSAKKGGKPVLSEDARQYRNGYSRGYKGYPAPAKGEMPKAYVEGWTAGNEKGNKRLKAKKPLP